MEVATHKQGCCVLQRCLDDCSEAQKAALIGEITFNALALSQDPFGNYVVQYLIEKEGNAFVVPLIRKLLPDAVALSVQKQSSNVIEKVRLPKLVRFEETWTDVLFAFLCFSKQAIKAADPESKALLIGQLVNNPEAFEAIVRNEYGNFVIQTALENADAFQRQQLVELIQPLLPSLRSTPFGKRMLTKYPNDFSLPLPVVDPTLIPTFAAISGSAAAPLSATNPFPTH